MQDKYVIASTFDDPDYGTLWWSNENGWVEMLDDATVFTQDQRDELNLPMQGEWRGWSEAMEGE